MGNFSRDPEVRLLDADTKHYIGHRVHQGVPLLDADLHLMEGLHRHELEGVGRWMLGNGVPVGSDAFRASALPNGGVDTLILVSRLTTPGLSSVAVDLVASTAAAALGFGPANRTVSRTGDSPARLTSGKAGPFVLATGQTLVVAADGGATETVTFQSADFGNIAAATAAEVAAVVSAGMLRIAAVAGTGNDLAFAGGDGTVTGAGRLFVDGRMALIERGLRYSEQPLYQNTVLAAAWGVDPVASIPTALVNESQTVFVDVWHREVNRQEDGDIVDSRIGIETAVSLRREWAIRVVPSAGYAAALAGRPAGHSYYPVTALHRGANNPAITTTMLADLRDTDASLRPEVAYRNAGGLVVVDTARFRDMLILTRDAARDFITYLTTQFVLPSATYLAAEMVGIETLSAIAATADHALGAIHAESLGTRGALGVMQQLYDAEKRFIAVWQSVVLPLLKGGNPVYQTAFGASIVLIKSYLDGPAPSGLLSIASAVAGGNLDGAVTSQERIATELGGQAGKPLGNFTVTYLGAVAPAPIQLNTPFDLRYQVQGTITPDDDLLANVFLDPGWTATLKNGDGSTPFALHAGPGVFNRTFLVTITPPAVVQPGTLLSVKVLSKKNPAGLSFVTAQKVLQLGVAPPPSDDNFAVVIITSSMVESGGVFPVPHGTVGDITFAVENHTVTPVSIDLDPGTSGVWGIAKGPFALPNHPVPANGVSSNFVWHFTAPVAVGNTLVFTLRARDTANNATIFAEATVSLIST